MTINELNFTLKKFVNYHIADAGLSHRICILGPNGCGKTTIAQAIALALTFKAPQLGYRVDGAQPKTLEGLIPREVTGDHVKDAIPYAAVTINGRPYVWNYGGKQVGEPYGKLFNTYGAERKEGYAAAKRWFINHVVDEVRPVSEFVIECDGDGDALLAVMKNACRAMDIRAFWAKLDTERKAANAEGNKLRAARNLGFDIARLDPDSVFGTEKRMTAITEAVAYVINTVLFAEAVERWNAHTGNCYPVIDTGEQFYITCLGGSVAQRVPGNYG